jgi:putative aldouronate transport system permease protein
MKEASGLNNRNDAESTTDGVGARASGERDNTIDYSPTGRLMARTTGDKIFDGFNVGLMVLLIIITLYPFWYSLIGSFNQGLDYMKGGVFLWPREFSLENYVAVFKRNDVINAYGVTIARTFIGTLSHVFITALFTYGFSRHYLKGRNLYAAIGLITLYFRPILISQYLLYSSLGLINNFLVYILPHVFNFYHVLIMQAFFRTIPKEVNESAMMDGATEYRIFFSLVLPLSKPVLATIALFAGVFHWNEFRDAMMFTTSESLQTIQVYLMRMIRIGEAAAQLAEESGELAAAVSQMNPKTIQLATMMVATVPILALYPFLQKYFVKGVMIGSIKG